MTDIHEGGCVCGAAFATFAYFDEKAIELTQGQLSQYEHRSDESGRWVRIEFCPRCGTTLSHSAEVRPGMKTISAATFDDPDWIRIERHIWARSKRPWVSIPPDVAVFPQGSAGAAPPKSSP